MRLFEFLRHLTILVSLIISLLTFTVDVSAEECDDSCVRDALSALYEATNGAEWKNSKNWLDVNIPVENWWGVKKLVNETTSDITYSIILGNNNLVGTLPIDEWIFPNLEILDVKNNLNLVGTLHENISSLTSLKMLGFRDSGVVGPLPSGFYNLPQLEIADLKSFQMSGETLSSEWGKLKSLKVLHFQGTKIVGMIPVEFFDMTSLELLNLSNNPGMSGSIPTEIGQLANLKEIRLDRLKLTGTVPSELFDLSFLETVILFRNFRLSAWSIPDSVNSLSMLKDVNLGSTHITGRLPAFSGSDMLTSLVLSNNELNSSIPEDFMDLAIYTAAKVDLTDNMLTGAIPESLGRFDDLDINLANNMIDHIPMELCENDRWISGVVAEFGCDAILCPIGTFNVEGRQSSAESVCEVCANSCYFGSVECGAEPCPTDPPTITVTNSPTTDFTDEPTSVPTVFELTSSPTLVPTIFEQGDDLLPSFLGTDTSSSTLVPTAIPTVSGQSEGTDVPTESFSPTATTTSSEQVISTTTESPTNVETEIIGEIENDPSLVSPEVGSKETDIDIAGISSSGVILRNFIVTISSVALSCAFLV